MTYDGIFLNQESIRTFRPHVDTGCQLHNLVWILVITNSTSGSNNFLCETGTAKYFIGNEPSLWLNKFATSPSPHVPTRDDGVFNLMSNAYVMYCSHIFIQQAFLFEILRNAPNCTLPKTLYAPLKNFNSETRYSHVNEQLAGHNYRGSYCLLLLWTRWRNSTVLIRLTVLRPTVLIQWICDLSHCLLLV